MSNYINIGHCSDYECVLALQGHVSGIQWDDITGEISLPEYRWNSLTSREKDYIQNRIWDFVLGRNARAKLK